MTDTEQAQTATPTADDAIELYRRAVRAATDAAATSETSTALVPAGGVDNAVTVKKTFQAEFEKVAVARRQAAELEKVAKAAIEAKKQELDALMRAMDAELQPMLKQMARLKDGISAVNLYLGRDEEIELIRDGQPAPADTPLIVRQMVLYADEECAFSADSGGIDVRDLEKFMEWLIADPAHVDQVIPDQRGIVAMQTRRNEKDYKDPWQSMALNPANLASWFLIRNGERVWFMQTDFSAGERLTPARDEFTSMFIDPRTGKPMEPGSSAWIRAENQADARTRHYLKVALILQGLVDRTSVFHPLPATGINLLTQDHYDAGIVRLIDDELAITSNRIPFRTWLAERARNAEVGERVIIGKFPYDKDDTRITPKYANGIHSLTAYTLARSEGQSKLYVTFDRTDNIWDDRAGGFRPPKTRGSYMIRRDDTFWLPVDRVTVAEMEDYLGARSERHHYADMFPALKAAIAFINAEHEQEAPFRVYLTGRLVTEAGLDLTDAEAQIEDLIRWFKTANKWHRPLNGDPAAEQKAAAAIVTEAKRRAGASGADDTILALAKDRYPDAVFVGRATDSYVVIVPEKRAYPALATNVFVHRIDLTKTGKVKSEKRWQIIAHAQRNRWTTLYAGDAWTTWKFNVAATDYATDQHAADLIDHALTATRDRDSIPLLATIKDVHGDHGFSSGPRVLLVTVWASGGEQPWDYDHLLTNPTKQFASLGGEFRLHLNKSGRDLTTKLGAGKWEQRRWDLPFNSGLQPLTDRNAVAPWVHYSPFSKSTAPTNVVYRDDDAITEELALAETWSKGRLAAAHAGADANQLITSIEDAYVAALVEQEHIRYIEDYGDNADLWEHHKGTLKISYPSSGARWDNHQFARGGQSPLRQIVSHAVETRLELDGITVSELMEKIELPDNKFLPEELHHLTFTRKDSKQ